MRNPRTLFITKVGILAALATGLMFIETPVPFTPGFLKLDVSEVPVLLGTFALGPIAGILIELVKNLVHVAMGSMTGGVGELANFLVGCAFLIPAGILYRRHKSRKSAVVALAAGSFAMIVTAGLLNLFVMLPLYAKFMPVEAIIAMGSIINPMITDYGTLVLLGITPFNIVKCVVLSILTLLIYKRVSPLLHRG